MDGSKLPRLEMGEPDGGCCHGGPREKRSRIVNASTRWVANGSTIVNAWCAASTALMDSVSSALPLERARAHKTTWSRCSSSACEWRICYVSARRATAPYAPCTPWQNGRSSILLFSRRSARFQPCNGDIKPADARSSSTVPAAYGHQDTSKYSRLVRGAHRCNPCFPRLATGYRWRAVKRARHHRTQTRPPTTLHGGKASQRADGRRNKQSGPDTLAS